MMSFSVIEIIESLKVLLRYKNSDSPPGEIEVSLVDILCFLKSTWKTIAITGIVGVIMAIVYLAIAPKQYEATSQIAVTKFGNTNPILKHPNLTFQGPTPLNLIIISLGNITTQTLDICGHKNQASITSEIKLTTLDEAAGIVMLKTFGQTPQIAQECNLAIFDLMKVTQQQFINPYIKSVKARILNDQDRLAALSQQIASLEKSNLSISVSYFFIRDEIRFLRDEILALNEVIELSQNFPTRIISSVYVSNRPVTPKKSVVLTVGCFGGLFLGLLIAVRRRISKN